MDTLGVTLEPASVAPGQRYWKLVEGWADDPDEGGGKINIFFKTKDLSGVFLGGVWVRTEWNGGQSDIQTKAPPDYGDFPMSGGNWCPSTPPGPYSTMVIGRNTASPDPSERVVGMGLPCNFHWSFRLIFEERIAGGEAATNTPTSTPTEVSTQPPPTIPIPTPTPGGSLIEDYEGGFTDGVANGWTAWQDSWGGPDQYASQSGRSGSGNSQGIRVYYGSGGAYRQDIPVTPGEEYILRAWIKTLNGDRTGPAAEDNSAIWAEFGYDLQNRDFATLGSDPAITYWDTQPKENSNLGSSQWQMFTTPAFTATDSAISIWVKAGSTSPGVYLDIDDWEVISTSAPADTFTPTPTESGPTATPTVTRTPGVIPWIMVEDGTENPTSNGKWPESVDDFTTVTANLSGDTPTGDNRYLKINNVSTKIKIRQEPSFLDGTGSTLRIIMRINSGGNAGNYGFEHIETFGRMEIGYRKNDENNDGLIQIVNGDSSSTTEMTVPNINHWHMYWFVHSTDGNTYFWLDPDASDDSLATADLVKANGTPGSSRLTWGCESTGQAVNQDIDDVRWALGEYVPADGEEIDVPTVTPTEYMSPTPTNTPTNTPMGQPAWKMSYARQYGFDLTAGVAGQAELFATYEDGGYAGVGMTNDANPNVAVFGFTGGPSDPYLPGNVRVNFDINNSRYDFHPYDPPIDSDRSPDCYWLDGLPHYGHYRFEFWWRRVADDARYEFRPNQPAYHYDQCNGFNNPPNEPAGFMSDDSDLSDWAEYQAQTFVVPANINRIIGAKCFGDKGFAQKFRMVFSIREGGPNGPQVGPSVTAREKDSNEFPNIKVGWGMDAVPVTPGGTYALRVEVLGGGGMNVHATNNNTYAQGMLYNGPTGVPGRDMVAVVVGAWRSEIQETETPTPTATETAVPTNTPTLPPLPDERAFGLFGFSEGWQRAENETPYYQPEYDRNSDAFIDGLDLLLLMQAWHGMATPVPTETETPFTPTRTPTVIWWTPTPTSPPEPTPTTTPSDVMYETRFETFQNLDPAGTFHPGDGSGGLFWEPPPSLIAVAFPPPEPFIKHWGGAWQPFDFLESTNSMSGSAQEIRIRQHPQGNLDAYFLVFQFGGANALPPGNYEASVWAKSNWANAGDFTDVEIGHKLDDEPIGASYYGAGQGLTDWTRIAIQFTVTGSEDHFIFVGFAGNVASNPAGYVAGYFDDMIIRKLP